MKDLIVRFAEKDCMIQNALSYIEFCNGLSIIKEELLQDLDINESIIAVILMRVGSSILFSGKDQFINLLKEIASESIFEGEINYLALLEKLQEVVANATLSEQAESKINGRISSMFTGIYALCEFRFPWTQIKKILSSLENEENKAKYRQIKNSLLELAVGSLSISVKAKNTITELYDLDSIFAVLEAYKDAAENRRAISSIVENSLIAKDGKLLAKSSLEVFADYYKKRQAIFQNCLSSFDYASYNLDGVTQELLPNYAVFAEASFGNEIKESEYQKMVTERQTIVSRMNKFKVNLVVDPTIQEVLSSCQNYLKIGDTPDYEGNMLFYHSMGLYGGPADVIDYRRPNINVIALAKYYLDSIAKSYKKYGHLSSTTQVIGKVPSIIISGSVSQAYTRDCYSYLKDYNGYKIRVGQASYLTDNLLVKLGKVHISDFENDQKVLEMLELDIQKDWNITLEQVWDCYNTDKDSAYDEVFLNTQRIHALCYEKLVNDDLDTLISQLSEVAKYYRIPNVFIYKENSRQDTFSIMMQKDMVWEKGDYSTSFTEE